MTEAAEGEGGRNPRAHRRRSPRSGTGRRRFERLVEEALREIPEPFRSRMENVAVVVEEKPSPDLLRRLGMSRGETLLGFYEGIPLTERGDWYNLVVPDHIIIFRQPILDICSSPEEIREQVRITVIHEVAHYYGIGDAELDEMGY